MNDILHISRNFKMSVSVLITEDSSKYHEVSLLYDFSSQKKI